VGILHHAKKYPEFIDRIDAAGASLAKPVAEPAFERITTTLFDWIMNLNEDAYAQHVVRFGTFKKQTNKQTNLLFVDWNLLIYVMA